MRKPKVGKEKRLDIEGETTGHPYKQWTEHERKAGHARPAFESSVKAIDPSPVDITMTSRDAEGCSVALAACDSLKDKALAVVVLSNG